MHHKKGDEHVNQQDGRRHACHETHRQQQCRTNLGHHHQHQAGLQPKTERILKFDGGIRASNDVIEMGQLVKPVIEQHRQAEPQPRHQQSHARQVRIIRWNE